MGHGRTALEDLRAWCSERGIDCSQRIRYGAAELRDLWNEGDQNPGTFYTQDEVGMSYMFDLTGWHASGSIDSWFNAVQVAMCTTGFPADHNTKILDFGAGIGTYSLMLARAGYKVIACEVNRTLREYMGWRVRRAGLENGIDIVSEPIENIPYDVVLSIDTIEHLSTPEDFPNAARVMLKRNGFMIATWTFHKSEGMHPMHHGEERLSSFIDSLNSNFEGPLNGDWPALFRVRP